MNNRLMVFGVASTLLIYGPSVLAQHQNIFAKDSFEITANVALASDYVFRGVSQTREDPAVQGGFDITHDTGLFAGIWSSNVDFVDGGANNDEADQEVDLYLGYGQSISENFSFDTSVYRYIYPGTAKGFDLDYTELLASLYFQDSLSATIGYSEDVFGTSEDGIYYQVAGSLPLPYEFVFGAAIGYYDLDDAYNNSYTDWNVGVGRSFGSFTVDVVYHDTSSDAEKIFGDVADRRVVLSLKANFDS